MAVFYSATARGFFDPNGSAPIPEDAVEITAAQHEALLTGQEGGREIVPDESGLPVLTDPVPPSLAEVLALRRAYAWSFRGPLCKALRAAGILSDASSVVAAKGDWPTEFEDVLAAMPETLRVDAQIDWADANVVRYSNPLLQEVALAYCQGDAAQATEILDGLFEVAP